VRKLLVIVALFACATAHAEKNRNTAFALSAGGAGISGALVISAFVVSDNHEPLNKPLLYTGLVSLVITPSLGQMYAGKWLAPGMIMRVGAAGLMGYGASLQDTTICDDGSPGPCKSINQTGVVLIGLGVIAAIGGASWDVRDAPHAADRYNQTHFAVAPTIMPTGAPGLSIAGYF
jgi:hypothetical protein